MSNGRGTRLPQVLVFADVWPQVQIHSERMELRRVAGNVPSPAELAAADVVLVIGPVQDAQYGLELAGAMKLALERGATLVFTYNARFQEFDQRFVYELVQFSGRPISGSVLAAATKPAPHPAFREYLTVHGQTDLQLHNLPEGVEVLAHAVVAIQPYKAEPTAVRIGFARGSLYILPYQPSASLWVMLERLVGAVLEHREGMHLTIPPFFETLRVPGEEEVVDGIAAAREELERLEGQRAALTRHKHLVGHFSSEQLERLVIEELNLVFSGTGVQARDVEERYVEDFELVDATGARKALGESKAAGGGVGLSHVDQVNSHRSELFDATADELAGLLVVNTFRNDDVANRRRESVNERVVRHARRMNVLILRSWDLYQLAVRRLAGQDDGADVLGALVGGGGWLEVEEAGLTTHTG
jgi:hypothetical protein